MIQDGQTYQNFRGDFRGPMRSVSQPHSRGYFLDQYGILYELEGRCVGHNHKSTANLDLRTAGTSEGWREEPAV